MKYQTDYIKLRRVNTRIIGFTFPIWLVTFFITFIPDGNVFADLFELELVQSTFKMIMTLIPIAMRIQ